MIETRDPIQIYPALYFSLKAVFDTFFARETRQSGYFDFFSSNFSAIFWKLSLLKMT